ncbi:unnamed protein product [marine sediment metagenome]|uniref:Uncharacterized protein n=1 Tax=marine sediment metagenome TaxID=412755 RepID=X0VAB1_9ZZZZ
MINPANSMEIGRQMIMMINDSILFKFIKDVTADETSDDSKLKS